MNRQFKPYKAVYVDIAREDVKAAKKWYKEQRDGLQKLFAASILEAIERMRQNPFAYAVRYKNIRIIHPYTFPYGIHFYIDEENKTVVITAIIHDYRDVAPGDI